MPTYTSDNLLNEDLTADSALVNEDSVTSEDPRNESKQDFISAIKIEADKVFVKEDLVIGLNGKIREGQPAYNTGTGFFLGYSDTAYKFSLGNPAGNRITWDGTNIFIDALHSNLMLYDAVIDAAGFGDYTTVQAAITAGETRLFVRKGTYSLTSNIVLTSGISITGESQSETIFDLNGFTIKSENDIPYRVGTITATNGSDLITGAGGTAWFTTLAVGDYIVFNGTYYKISNIITNNSLRLTRPYNGNTLAGLPYFAGTFATNIYLDNFTISGQDLVAAGNALYFRGCVDISVSEILFKENDMAFTTSLELDFVFNSLFNNLDFVSAGYNGLNVVDANYNHFNNVSSNGNANNGIVLYGASNNAFNNINANSNNAAGVVILDDSTGYNLNSNKNTFSNLNCFANKRSGLYLAGTGATSSNFNLFTNSNFDYNLIHGIEHSYANYNNFVNCNTSNNGDNGILLDNASIGNKIDNCNTFNNTNSGIELSDASNYNIVRGNYVLSNDNGIIESTGDENYNIFANNIIRNSITTNLTIVGANSINDNNIA